jgi:Flp pilus assembly pilin Flp
MGSKTVIEFGIILGIVYVAMFGSCAVLVPYSH